MASFDLDGADLVVRLSALEKLGAMRGDVRIPLAAVRDVRVSDRYAPGVAERISGALGSSRA